MKKYFFKINNNRERTLLSDSDLKRPKYQFIYLVIFTLLFLGTFTALVPFVWGALSAIKTSREIFVFPPKLLPTTVVNESVQGLAYRLGEDGDPIVIVEPGTETPFRRTVSLPANDSQDPLTVFALKKSKEGFEELGSLLLDNEAFTTPGEYPVKVAFNLDENGNFRLTASRRGMRERASVTFSTVPNIPWRWQWENYVTAWERIRFMKYFWNTLIVIFGVWFFAIVPNALAGYALSKYNFRAHKFLMLLFFSTLLVPFQSILVPLFLTVQKIPILGINLMDMFNSWFAVMLPAGVNAFNIFVFKSFFDDIPDDLLEAARIDGASEARIFLQVIVPLSRSVFAVLTIFVFMGAWNDFLWPYLVIKDQVDYTIMLRLFTFSTQADVPYNILLSALMLASLPPIALFLIFQKQIMQGISLTGLKM